MLNIAITINVFIIIAITVKVIRTITINVLNITSPNHHHNRQSHHHHQYHHWSKISVPCTNLSFISIILVNTVMITISMDIALTTTTTTTLLPIIFCQSHIYIKKLLKTWTSQISVLRYSHSTLVNFCPTEDLIIILKSRFDLTLP